MKINADDPKWTAYVLGEMDETERAALELELESSEEAREFVEELRLAASVMKDGLASEAARIRPSPVRWVARRLGLSDQGRRAAHPQMPDGPQPAPLAPADQSRARLTRSYPTPPIDAAPSGLTTTV